MRPLARLGAALLAALLAAVPAAAPGQSTGKLINPCNFGEHQTPCRVEGGEYRVLLPEGIGPFPAVVYLYGSLGESQAIVDADYFQTQVVRRGYALIVPQALKITYAGNIQGTGWGRRIRAHRHPRDDLAFLRRVVFDAKRRVNIDPNNLIWAGQSDGGFMVWEIACHHPDMGVAFAAHAASYGGRLPPRCAGPVRFLHAHAPDDRIVPFEGERRSGPVVDSADLGQALSLLARTNLCQRGPGRAKQYHGFLRRKWETCAPNSALDLLVHDGGHSWPPSWMPAVLDWYSEVSYKPAVSRSVRVGERSSGTITRRSVSGNRGGRFIKAPGQ